MGDEGRGAALLAAWQRMRAHNEWQLVADDGHFLARAAAIAAEVVGETSAGNLAQTAVTRAYGELLHRGLLERRERAAQELWLAFWRLGLRRGVGEEAAEELAQEAMARVFAGLPGLRSPQSLIYWAFRIFSTVARERAASEQAEAAPGDDAPEAADPSDGAAEVEQAAADSALLELLRAKLPNDLEREVLLRVVGRGDHPRDVARDLGLPLHRARLAKSRALKRLREDEDLRRVLAELAGDPDLQRERGGSDDEPEV